MAWVQTLEAFAFRRGSNHQSQELSPDSTVSKIETVQMEGERLTVLISSIEMEVERCIQNFSV